jgi:hypothetical protein
VHCYFGPGPFSFSFSPGRPTGHFPALGPPPCSHHSPAPALLNPVLPRAGHVAGALIPHPLPHHAVHCQDPHPPPLLRVSPSSGALHLFLIRPRFKMSPSASSSPLLPFRTKSGHPKRTTPPPHSPRPFVQATSLEHCTSLWILAGNVAFLPPLMSHLHVPFFE